MSLLKHQAKNNDRYVIPRTVRDVIPIMKIWNDGTFLVGTNTYSKSFAFTDINYQSADEDDKRSVLSQYASLLAGIDTAARAKITVSQKRINEKNFERDVFLPLRGDEYDRYCKEYNEVVRDEAITANGMVRERYLTLTIEKRTPEEARAYFSRVGSGLIAKFAALGSKCTELNAEERLRILHDFYRQGEESSFRFDAHDMMKLGHDFRDYICPDGIERFNDYLMIGGKYARVLFLKDYGSTAKDDILTHLTDFRRTTMLSIDYTTVPTDEAVKLVDRIMMGIETNAANYQRKQNRHNNWSAQLPYEIEQQRAAIKEYMDDLTERDQCMVYVLITAVITADTKEQLDIDTDAILTAARERLCQMAILRFQQTDGLNTVLPIGVRKIDAMRTMTTENMAAFLPFRVQEIQEAGGVFFGVNAISRNLILCNSKNLLNQSMFLLGSPGSGKSFYAKMRIVAAALSSNDSILICDPEGEYSPLVKALGGVVIQVSAGGSDYINAMEMAEGYEDKSPIAEKSEFLMSFFQQIDNTGEVGFKHKSVIDRCVERIYEAARKSGVMPTLCTLRDELTKQPEQEARDLALSLEMYTVGTMNIFSRETNVDTSARIICYDLHNLGGELKRAALLVITDAIRNRVSQNWRDGKWTYIFIDEIHVMFENEYGRKFLSSAWRMFRKRSTYPCGITQNITYLADDIESSTMLSNSEMVVMLNQGDADRELLQRLLGIPEEQLSYVTSAAAGSGLIKYGGKIVPFYSSFPKNTELYNLMTTKSGEGVFGGSARTL